MFLFLFKDIIELIDLFDDCDALSSIRQLTWLDYPYVFHSIFRIFLLSQPLELLRKRLILRVRSTVLYMVSQRDYLEYIFFLKVIVLLQVVE